VQQALMQLPKDISTIKTNPFNSYLSQEQLERLDFFELDEASQVKGLSQKLKQMHLEDEETKESSDQSTQGQN
jgi:hypothetical protein